MTIIVTGGAGFIGSNLCSKLVKDKEPDASQRRSFFLPKRSAA